MSDYSILVAQFESESFHCCYYVNTYTKFKSNVEQSNLTFDFYLTKLFVGVVVFWWGAN